MLHRQQQWEALKFELKNDIFPASHIENYGCWLFLFSFYLLFHVNPKSSPRECNGFWGVDLPHEGTVLMQCPTGPTPHEWSRTDHQWPNDIHTKSPHINDSATVTQNDKSTGIVAGQCHLSGSWWESQESSEGAATVRLKIRRRWSCSSRGEPSSTKKSPPHDPYFNLASINHFALSKSSTHKSENSLALYDLVIISFFFVKVNINNHLALDIWHKTPRWLIWLSISLDIRDLFKDYQAFSKNEE